MSQGFSSDLMQRKLQHEYVTKDKIHSTYSYYQAPPKISISLNVSTTISLSTSILDENTCGSLKLKWKNKNHWSSQFLPSLLVRKNLCTVLHRQYKKKTIAIVLVLKTKLIEFLSQNNWKKAFHIASTEAISLGNVMMVRYAEYWTDFSWSTSE